MDGYKDAHTHIHPSESETKAFLKALGFGLDSPFSGTVEQDLTIMDRAGIATTVIVPLIATSVVLAERMTQAAKKGKPDRDELIQQLASEQSAYNRWAVAEGRRTNGRFAALVAVDPVMFGADWTRKEIEARISEGAVGIKILPMYIGVYPSDPKMAVVWEEADRRGLAVLTLALDNVPAQGLARISLPESYGDIQHPKVFEEGVRSYPRCKLVLAHLGHGAEEDAVRLANKYPNVFTDTSLRLSGVGKAGGWTLKETAELLRRFGTDRVLFATNYPFVDPAEYVDTMKKIPLTDAEKHQICSANYDRVYGGAVPS